MTPAETTKALAEALASFPLFCGLLKIQPKEGGGRIPFDITPIQKRFNEQRTSRDIVLKGRQIGFTTNECARDLWWFLTKPGAKVVVVVQSQTNYGALKDISGKIALFVDSLRKLGIKLEFGTESGTEWTLPDQDASLRVIQAGASLMSASNKGRGGVVNRLHVTEAAFFAYAQDTFNSLMESVAQTGSEVVNESTPYGASGFYYEQWMAAVEGRSAYKPHFIGWWDHPEYAHALEPGEIFVPQDDTEVALLKRGVKPECVKWRRWKIRDKGGNVKLVDQEYPNDPDTCFLVSGRGFFDQDGIKKSLSSACDPIQIDARGMLKIWQQPERGETYVIGADTSEGGGGDPSAALVYKRSTGEHVATIHGQLIPEEYAKLLAWVARRYNGALIAVERNNHGHAVILAIQSIAQYKALYRHLDDKIGWPTNEVTRTPMLDQLDASHRRGIWATKDRTILGEMRTFTVSERGKPEAAQGSHDDLVMAAAIGWAVLSRPQKRVALLDE